MKQQTTSEAPITLPDPTRPPKPAPGCDVCAALDRQRAAAEGAGNIAQATTCEQEMRRHPAHGDRAAVRR
ncbi:hypothetical protein ACH40F_07585 [Streptomyces sp. NPDC020794]|uniref:hypothetical protein n=1 Tax=unclassified Streptomyces TaxID=2593676 RepID=UPI0036ECFB06